MDATKKTSANPQASKKQLEKTSKFLSFVLRHKPEAVGLELDPNGWADLVELMDKASSEISLDRNLIRQVVASSDKQRFALSDDGRRIRANQGHSVKVDLELRPKDPPAVLFHGTATRFLPSILQEGLRPGQRHHVHLSTDVETATSVGKRHGDPVILRVSASEMHSKGHLFFLSDNGVWLTDEVPPAFLRED